MSRGGPPELARKLIERRLPNEMADAVVGDLHAEYVSRAARTGRLRADLWYWGQLATLRAGALRRASRSMSAVRPAHEGRSLGEGRGRSVREVASARAADLGYALRRLAATPGFSAVAVLSLGLGIGANTAIFSIVNAVLIRDLPVTDERTLVEVYSSSADGMQYGTSSHADYLDLRNENDVFANVVGTRSFIARMDVDGAPRVVFGELVSWDYFQTLGVPMTLGRAFSEEEDRSPGTHPVAILGYRTWVRDHGSDPDVIGRSVQLNGRAYTVVGVAPRAFTGSMPVLVTGFFVPLMMTDVVMAGDQLARRGSRNMFIKARLRPDMTVDGANAGLQRVSTSLQERYPDTNRNRVMSALPASSVSIHPEVDGMLAPVAGLLLGVVGVVLLISCANLASFLLARAEDRRRDVAVRLALGAGRARLVMQLLIETTLLAALGGLLGILFAHWTVDLLMALRPPLPVPVDIEISLDRTVLAFTATVALAAGLAFGMLPALQATNPDVAPTLKGAGAAAGTRRRVGLRNSLVVTQVALSFVLLIGAGLFVRSLEKARAIDPGFDTGAGALIWPMPDLSGYMTPEEVDDFYRRLEARLRAEPVVTGIAMADRLPLGSGVQTGGYVLPGVPTDSPDGDHDIDNANVNAGYFDAMGVDIVRGRGFTDADLEGERVVVVSEAFVDRFYPDTDIVGRTIETDRGLPLRVIGVAEDTRVRTLGEAPRPYVYQLNGQAGYFDLQVVVKGSATSQELVAIARDALQAIDPDVVLFEEVKTMNEHLALLLYPPRMAAMLLSAFGVLALLLAGIGIHGVVSYAVARRTRELGIRMSLGATARDVVSMAVAGGMKLVLVGGAIGVVLAAAVTWAVSGYLFGISSRDLGTFVAIPLLLTAVALVAAWMPARRASRVDPVRALRTE